MARSMLSFGIELSRAFWIAAPSGALASGSGPPSRAATMIARDSFEKSCPRLASAAPFLCLIEDHLLWPDNAYPFEEGARGGTRGSPAIRPPAMPRHGPPLGSGRGRARAPV